MKPPKKKVPAPEYLLDTIIWVGLLIAGIAIVSLVLLGLTLIISEGVL